MKKGHHTVIDTYDDFLTYRMDAVSKSLDEQVALWQTSYMAKYPELLRKQIRTYREMKVNWQDIARRIIQLIPRRLRSMQEARENLLQICETLFAKAAQKLGLDFDIVFVIYIGIGCGAGWATVYKKKPAVLIGLENIAQEKWHKKKKLEGLICHEIGHLAHMKWRNEWTSFEKAEDNPMFRLYSEGFAQRCEEIILRRKTWHFEPNRNWRVWCEQRKSWLANEFLKRLERQASVNEFFGSWFNIEGKKQTGYFLGHTFIRHLEETSSLREIALFNPINVTKLGFQYLKSVRNEKTR